MDLSFLKMLFRGRENSEPDLQDDADPFTASRESQAATYRSVGEDKVLYPNGKIDMPEALLEKICAILNSGLPEVVRNSVDKQKERESLYNELQPYFETYTETLTGKNAVPDSIFTLQQQLERMQCERQELMGRITQLEQERNSSQEGQLCAERQQRTISDHIEELEGKVLLLQREKEETNRSRQALKVQLSRERTQRISLEAQIGCLGEEKTILEHKYNALERRQRTLCEGEEDPQLLAMREEIATLETQLHELHELQIAHALLADQSEQQKAQIQELKEAESAYQTQIATLKAGTQPFQEAQENQYADQAQEIARLQEALKQAEALHLQSEQEKEALHLQLQEIETQRCTADLATQAEALQQAQTQIEVLQHEIEQQSNQYKEAQAQTEELRLQLQAAEEKQLLGKDFLQQAQVRQKEAEAQYESLQANYDALVQKQSEPATNEEVQNELKKTRHELQVTTDLYEAMKQQREALGLRVDALEDSLKEQTLAVGKLEKALARAKAEKKERKLAYREQEASLEIPLEIPIEVGNGTEEALDWLLPTRPDTPEEIAARKAAEKRAKEEQEPIEKMREEPDPAQMSLW